MEILSMILAFVFALVVAVIAVVTLLLPVFFGIINLIWKLLTNPWFLLAIFIIWWIVH